MRRRADDGARADPRTALVARPLAATGLWRPIEARRRDAAAVGLRRATHLDQRELAAVSPPLRRGAGDRDIFAGEPRATTQRRFAGRTHGAPGRRWRLIRRRRLIARRLWDRVNDNAEIAVLDLPSRAIPRLIARRRLGSRAVARLARRVAEVLAWRTLAGHAIRVLSSRTDTCLRLAVPGLTSWTTWRRHAALAV